MFRQGGKAVEKPNYTIEKKYHPHWEMPRFHFHQACEFFLPLHNHGTFYIGEHSFPITEHSLFFLPSNTLHRSETPKAHRRFVLHLAPQTLESLSTKQTDFTKLTQTPWQSLLLSGEELAQTHLLFHSLLTQENDGSFGNDLHQTTALLNLLIFLTPLFPIPEKEAQGKDQITPIIDYIQENLAEPLSLDKISASFYVSKFYLCRIFKASTGFTVMEYIIACRIAQAKTLLLQGYSVQTAGELSGFSDNSHFIRTFGKLSGVSPGQYAKQYKDSQHIT